MTVTALIVAAGKGERLGGTTPKQFRMLGGKPVLRRAVEPFRNHPRIGRVVAVIPPGQESAARAALGGLAEVALVEGGETRAQSVRNGLAAVQDEAVLIHDAARPFCPAAVIDRLLDALQDGPAAVPVLPVADSLMKRTAMTTQAVDRDGLLRVQTPQAFDTRLIKQAFSQWSGPPPTDESAVSLATGLAVAPVAGAEALFKLTTAEDWARAEMLVQSRTVHRTGSGFDVHAFAGDGPLTIAGIEVPHGRGLAGHSDADVALHAITDALLGAAALGDIGQHFPPSDPQWKGAASDLFLAHAARLIRHRGGTIDHVDCTIIGEEPRIGPHRERMRARVAAILDVAPGQVSIKATTTEQLGFTGRREGLAAQAVASIRMEIEE
jgi:2-C-methyl-D-erythritol 4-phosphate cytidylyltransferase / 2-C-methyl-D-erythritol 2,4-cyclodiphosphate synthase